MRAGERLEEVREENRGEEKGGQRRLICWGLDGAKTPARRPGGVHEASSGCRGSGSMGARGWRRSKTRG